MLIYACVKDVGSGEWPVTWWEIAARVALLEGVLAALVGCFEWSSDGGYVRKLDTPHLREAITSARAALGME